jgi:GntR family transcriptional regulator
MALVNKRKESTNKSEASPDFHPLYLQIKELLIQRVLRGDWRPGELLPSEFKLAAEFNVSQGTVRKALDELAAEKAVIRMQGKGTFVAARNTRHTPLHFFRLIHDSGQRWEPHNTRQIFFKEDDPTEEETKNLVLPADSKVLRIQRLRYFADKPMICETITLAAARFPNFETVYRQAQKANLYVLLEKDYGILVVKADEKLRARAATEHEAKVLELAPNTPVLDIERLSLAIDGAPIEFRHMVCETSQQYYATSST